MAGLFDEIAVVDTGSKDRTREIAGEFGARVFEFAWVDEFAAATSAALARATGDHAFWLEADDVIDPPEGEKLDLLHGQAAEAETTWRRSGARLPKPIASGSPSSRNVRATRKRLRGSPVDPWPLAGHAVRVEGLGGSRQPAEARPRHPVH